MDGIKTDAMMEISIRWKLPYVYEDEDLQNIVRQFFVVDFLFFNF